MPESEPLLSSVPPDQRLVVIHDRVTRPVPVERRYTGTEAEVDAVVAQFECIGEPRSGNAHSYEIEEAATYDSVEGYAGVPVGEVSPLLLPLIDQAASLPSDDMCNVNGIVRTLANLGLSSYEDILAAGVRRLLHNLSPREIALVMAATQEVTGERMGY